MIPARTLWLAVAACLYGLAAQAAPPNILLLVADDYGLDVARFVGAPDRVPTTPDAPRTPNLGRLAKAGLLFTHAYSNPSCTPTRATIFTGRYGFRTGVGYALLEDNNRYYPALRPEELNLAQMFQAHAPAYALAQLGKWHLSYDEADPNRYGWPYYAGDLLDLGKLPDYSAWQKTVNGVTATSTTYATTDVVDEALGAIGRAEANHQPWLVWAAFNAPHQPFHLPPAALHLYGGLPDDPAAIEANPRPYFEAMVQAMDTEIGRLLASVDLKRTLVIFLGDNGTDSLVVAPPYDPKRSKPTLYENGVRVPLIVAGAGVKAPGRWISDLVNTVDLFPTMLDVAGIDPALATQGGQRAIDGISLKPYLASATAPKARRAFVYAELFRKTFDDRFERMIRDGRYKLIERADGRNELYDLRNDHHETRDLLAASRTLSTTQAAGYASLKGRLDQLIAGRPGATPPAARPSAAPRSSARAG